MFVPQQWNTVILTPGAVGRDCSFSQVGGNVMGELSKTQRADAKAASSVCT
jgi:hypothetical protein